MYPQREIDGLARLKASRRRTIALHRSECAALAARIAEPLDWIDRMRTLCVRLARLTPADAATFVLLCGSGGLPGLKILAPMLRWGPVVYGVVDRLRRRPRGK